MLELWTPGPSGKGLRGKRHRESWCAGSSPAAGLEALPILEVVINGKQVRALLDTGCSRTVIATWVSGAVKREPRQLVSVDGSHVACVGTATAVLRVRGRVMEADCVVLDRLFTGVDAVLGLDVLTRMGGVVIDGDGVSIGSQRSEKKVSSEECRLTQEVGGVAAAMPELVVEDQDFSARFDGSKWTVSWKWKDRPPELTNQIGVYKSTLTTKRKGNFKRKSKSGLSRAG